MRLAPPFRKGQLLRRGNVLIAKEDHPVVEQNFMDFCEGCVVDVAQVAPRISAPMAPDKGMASRVIPPLPDH